MLDWKRVMIGDGDYELAVLFIRFHLLQRPDLWPAFREGYEHEAETRVRASPRVEFYLISRALLASSWSPIAIQIVYRLLHGEELGFEKRSAGAA